MRARTEAGGAARAVRADRHRLRGELRAGPEGIPVRVVARARSRSGRTAAADGGRAARIDSHLLRRARAPRRSTRAAGEARRCIGARVGAVAVDSGAGADPWFAALWSARKLRARQGVVAARA